MVYERPMDDPQEKEKTQASRTYSLPKKRGLETQKVVVTHMCEVEIIGYARVSGNPAWRKSEDIEELI
jgi:hypothetical protein